MDDVLGRAWYELGARDAQLDRDLREAEAKVRQSGGAGAQAYEKQWSDSSKKIVGHVRGIGVALAAVGIGIGISGLLNFFGSAVGAASDLNEEVSKAGIVFGDSAGEVEAFADKADRALGQSKQQALAAAGGFGNMFRTIGLADDAAAGMSMSMVQLASDMASFNNEDPSDMLDRLRAGLSGEAEPLRRFGVLLSEARVKQQAYADGIAAVGAELTEQQKVQARYNLILQDTKLQQGDFARTADGLANSQRTQAAVMENSLARIGQALLPLAKAMTNFATDVMPGVGDAITSILKLALPLLDLMLGLGKMWLQHANVIIPVLALALGVKLVGSLNLVELRAKLAALALKGVAMAALLGIPYLIEGAEAVGSFVDSLVKGEKAAAEFEKLTDVVGGSEFIAQLLSNNGIAAKDFARLVEAAGGDAAAALKTLGDAGFDFQTAMATQLRSGTDNVTAYQDAWNEARSSVPDSARAIEQGVNSVLGGMDATMRNRVEALMAAMEEVPGGVAVELENGKTVVAASAEALASVIPNALREADEEAQEAAREIPGNIAASILEGRDAVVQAAIDLGKAATDPLVERARIDEIRTAMDEQQKVIAQAIRDGERGAAAAARAEYQQLEIELAGHLLRQDPKSKEAAQLLRKYTESEDPATQAAVKALFDAVGVRYETLKLDAEQHAVDTGQALPKALDDTRAEAARAQFDTNAGVLLHASKLPGAMAALGLDAGGDFGDGIGDKRNVTNAENAGANVGGAAKRGLNVDAYSIGYGVVSSYFRGLNAAFNGGVPDFTGKIAVLTALLDFSGSPPFTRSRNIGAGVGFSWAQGIVGSMRRARAQIASEMPNLGAFGASPGAVIGGLGGQQAALAGAPGGSSVSSVSTSNVKQVHLHVTGREPVIDTARDAVDLIQRMSWLDG